MIFIKLLKTFPTLKKEFIVYGLYTFVTSILDLFGISLVASFATFFVNPSSSVSKKILILENYLNFDIKILLSALIILIFILKGFIIYLFNKKVFIFCFNKQHELRVGITEKIFFSNFNKNHNKFKDNFTLLFENLRILTEDFLSNFIKFISDLFILCVILFYLLFIDFFTTLALLAVLSFSYFLYRLVLKKIFINLSQKRISAYKDLVEIFDYVLLCIREITFYKKEIEFKKFIEKKSKDFTSYSASQNSLGVIPKYYVEFILVVFLLLASFILSSTTNNKDSIFYIGLYVVAASRLAPLTSNILYTFSVFWKSRFALNDYLNFEETNTTVVNKYQNLSIEDNFRFDSFVIKNITFSYKDKFIIFDNANLVIEKNNIYGIFGKSGCGKTTLINIILGFLSPSKIDLLINNKVEKDFLKVSCVSSYIPQETILMNDSILSNITLSLEKNFDKEKLKKALDLSMLNEFLHNGQDKINYVVGHHGNNISGGQKQRISLARSIYFEKQILILDEPTSHLDEESENLFFNNLEKLKKYLTIIIISHNSDVKKYCDKIFIIKNKKILEENK
jgi:ABC-type multidrug transport system fused ATPase/permease subunit